MKPRYAVYYAPAPEHPLHAAASAWLGRDAATGEDLRRLSPPELSSLDLDALTSDPRGYGFHATLKAPFELADAATEEELVNALADFANARAAFGATITPATIGDFIAFRIEGKCPNMDALASDCVRAFERFRAPISHYDIARKRKAGLTPKQDEYLLDFGYPYVFEFFQFHMTLTGRILDKTARDDVVRELKTWFAPVSGLHTFNTLTLFKQNERNGPFQHICQAPLAP